MAFTSSDLDAIDRAIASGVLSVRFADGRQVQYNSAEALLKARAMIAGAVRQADPANQPGGFSLAEWCRG